MLDRHDDSKIALQGTAHCPGCGKLLDGATCTDPNSEPGVLPGPGDVSICIACATISVVQDDYSLVEATETDLKKLSEDDLESLVKAKRFIEGGWHGRPA